MPEELVTPLNSLEIVREMRLPGNSSIVLKIPSMDIVKPLVIREFEGMVDTYLKNLQKTWAE